MNCRKPITVITSIVLIAIIFSCDSTDRIDTSDEIYLAPGNANQKIYACQSTMTYHLANCQRLTPDKVVMLKSEAIALGYSACELCFPQEKELIPHVYISDDGYRSFYLYV